MGDDVDFILNHTPIRSPQIRVVKSGIHHSLEKLLGPAGNETNGRSLALEAMMNSFRSGATIVVQGVEEFHPKVRKFARDLAWDTSARVHVNLYISPPNAQGLPTHMDGHEILVLQISGTKNWTMYPNTSGTLPSDGFGPLPDENLEAPVSEFQVSAGDLLYIPRGAPHFASTTGRLSVHATVGITGQTYADLLVHSIKKWEAEDRKLQRYLPWGFARDESILRALRAEISDMLADPRFETDGAIDDAKQAADRALGVELNGHLVDLSCIDDLHETTEVRVRPGVRGSIEFDGPNVCIDVHGKQIVVPHEVSRTIADILFGPPRPAGALSPDLSPKDSMELSRVLIEQGVLTFSTPNISSK